LADLAEREGDYARAGQACAGARDVLRGLEKSGRLQGGMLKGLLSRAEAQEAAYAAAASLTADPPGEAGHWLLALRAVALARRGEHAESAVTSDRLRARAGDQAIHLFNVARGYALCVQAVAGRKDAEGQALQRRYAEAALSALREALRLDPFVEHHLEPDLDSIRRHPDYPLRGSKEQS
jgi:hypothetical protein